MRAQREASCIPLEASRMLLKQSREAPAAGARQPSSVAVGLGAELMWAVQLTATDTSLIPEKEMHDGSEQGSWEEGEYEVHNMPQREGGVA